MMGNDDARFLEGLRYGQALLNEGRSRLHKSVPGALVAEVLRHIENSMAGTSQYELERMLLGSDHAGAEWRAYVAHRHRSVTEKRLWRTWYGRHGKKDTIPPRPVEDAFGIQAPPLPPTEAAPPMPPPSEPNRPLMKALPHDGRAMSFGLLREIVKRWSAILIQKTLEDAARINDEQNRGRQLVRALLRHEMVLMPLWSQINAWEAFCEVLPSGESFALLDAAKQSFFSALEAIEQREHTRLMASYAALRKRYPELEIGLGQT